MHVINRWALALVTAAGLVGASQSASAQGVFPAPETFPDLRLEVAGTVNAIVKYNDGVADYYLIGGDFDLVNGVARRNLARLTATGSLDGAWSADADGIVTALALSGDQLFAGGTFTEVDGQPRLRLARIDADDGQVAAWAPDANGAVNALQTDGTTVWAGGAFTNIEGTPRFHAAAISAGTGTVGAFNANLAGGAVYALLRDGGDLYIGGQGKLRGNQRGLIKVNATTGAQISWNPAIASKGGSRIRALAADGTSIYAVGIIRRIGNTNWGNGARWTKTSPATLQTWNPNSDAEILAVSLGGAFAFVGGDFLNLGGHTRLARTDATSGAASVGWDADADRRVATLLVDGAQLLVGGGFAEIEGAGAQGGLSRISTATAAIDATFMGDAAGPGTVSAFAIDADGGVILGGSFDAARQDGEAILYPRRNVVRLLPAGGAEAQYELDKVWGVTAAGEVFGVAIAGADLYLGGNFAQVNGSARTRLAKLVAATGVLDALWLPTADAPVRHLAADATNSRLYMAGDFITVSGTARDGVARVAASGTGALSAWNPQPDDSVDAILVSGSDVYLGGSFTTLNGAAHVGLARVDDATGTADATFVADVDGPVHALGEGTAGIYVGGQFVTLDGASRNSIGRVAVDGTVDANWDPSAGTGLVDAIAVDEASGLVYFGGSFALAGDDAHANLARAGIAGLGVVDPSWRPGTDGNVVQIAVPQAGQVLAAGAFVNVTGVMRNGVALLGTVGSDLTSINIDSVTPTGGTAGTNSVFGQGYAVAWTVTNDTSAATPTGSVTVTASTGESCTAVASAGSCALTATATGARTLIAVFTGDPLFVDSASTPAAHTVDPAQTTLTVSTAPFPSLPADTVTATITLNVAAPGGGTPQGQVVITVNGGAGCTIDLSLGTSCSLGALAPFGYYDIDATYTDSAAPARHVAAPATTLHAVGTITTLSLDIPGTATVGTAVTVTVTTTGIPNGEQITVDGGLDCNITINADTGTCQLTFDAAGSIPVTAAYAGNAPLLPAQDAATVVVSRLATSIVLSALPALPAIGETVTLTATTTGINDGAVLTVTNAPTCPTITISGNTGGCTTSFASAGPVTVTADFAQTAGRDAATDDLLIGVGKIATSFGLSLAPSNPVIGQSVTVSLTAPQLPGNALVTITGGSGCTIDRNVSDSCALTFAGAGTLPVNGQFAETATHFGSTASTNATVGKNATSFGLSLAPSNPAIGQSVTVSLTAPQLPGNALVTITGGSGCTIDRNVSDSCALTFASNGTVPVNGQFAETATHFGSTASTDATVGKIATSFGLALAPAAPVVGEPVTVTLTSPVLPADAIIAVTGGSGCTVDRNVSDSCTLSFVAAGAATVTGQFVETATHLASTASSNPTVARAATAFTTFNASLLTAQPGGTITFTWTVAASAPGQGTPTGNVRVSVNGNGTAPNCTVPVAAGTCNIVFPAEGSFAMRADYLGDANFNASFSVNANVIIASAAPTDADLQIAKIVSRSRLDPANQIEIVEYQIVVANAGPATVTGALISDVLPASLSAAVWTCAPDDGGASCGAAGGNGNVSVTANLAADSSVTITLQADVDDAPLPGVRNTATVAAPAGQNDPVAGNNSDTVLYQACAGNRGGTLIAHFCTFKDGFETPPQ